MSSEQLTSLMLVTVFITFIVNIGVALYGVFVKRSLLKKLMALAIFSDSVNIFAIAVGFRYTVESTPSPPVMPSIPGRLEDIEAFANISVDPIPQAFVLTAIVIGLSITMFMLGLIIKYYEHYGTLDLIEHLKEEGGIREEVAL